MIAAWGEGYFPYVYRHDPIRTMTPGPREYCLGLYREMWGSMGSCNWMEI